jgi:hypothetical protein
MCSKNGNRNEKAYGRRLRPQGNCNEKKQKYFSMNLEVQQKHFRRRSPRLTEFRRAVFDFFGDTRWFR